MTAWQRRLGRLPARELGAGLRVHDAHGFVARGRGLGGLDALPAECALYLRARAVHTFTMRFPLDLIWLGRDGEVVRVDRDVPPWRQRACARARAVIETNAGCADRFLAEGWAAILRFVDRVARDTAASFLTRGRHS